MAISLQQRLQIARKAAQAAGNVIMAHYGRTLNIQTKSSDTDLVTQVDLECDELIREIISEAFPDDKLITEETTADWDNIDLSSTWIVDPLDGTTNYAHSFPHFAVSIAYVQNGVPQVAVVFDPFKNELFTATEDDGAYRNGVPLAVSSVDTLHKSLLATGFPYSVGADNDRDGNLSIDLHTRFLKQSHGIRRAGAAALDLAYVAAGRLDGFWELRLSPWDVAAGMLLIQKAGGTVTTFHGETINLSHRHLDLVGANSTLHGQLLDTTRTVYPCPSKCFSSL